MGIPIFEIETQTESIKIYANGVVEGLTNCRIINRISAVIHEKFIDHFSKQQSILIKKEHKITKKGD